MISPKSPKSKSKKNPVLRMSQWQHRCSLDLAGKRGVRHRDILIDAGLAAPLLLAGLTDKQVIDLSRYGGSRVAKNMVQTHSEKVAEVVDGLADEHSVERVDVLSAALNKLLRNEGYDIMRAPQAAPQAAPQQVTIPADVWQRIIERVERLENSSNDNEADEDSPYLWEREVYVCTDGSLLDGYLLFKYPNYNDAWYRVEGNPWMGLTLEECPAPKSSICIWPVVKPTTKAS